MAAIVNDRDVLIMSAVPRYTAATNSGLFLTPPAAVFKKSASGLTATPSSFVFKATLLNLVGTVSFSWTGGLSFVVNGNEATLNYSSDMAASGSLTASVTVDGVMYSQTSTITTLADGLPGTPGLDSPPQTAAQLNATLLGQITASQFIPALQSTITLIEAPATTAGSVTARVKAESDARIAAMQTEVSDRGAAITAAINLEVGARNTAIVNYGYTKEASDQSLAQFGTAVTAAYRTYTDNKTGQALTDAKAFTQSWGYSIADANAAIAASASTLQANINSAASTARAYTESWGYSKAAVDAAETAQFNTLTANYQGYANGVGQAATSASDAAMRSYTMSTASINGAITANSIVLTASYTNAINAVAVAGRNIVRDGAFELGLRPWTTKSAYVNRVGVLGEIGGKYLFIESVSATGPDNDVYVNGDGPPIPVTPGVQYVIAFDYATAQSSSITASSCYMYMFAGSNGAGGFGLSLPVLDTGSNRLRASQLWTCPPEVTSLLPRFGIHTTGYAWMAAYNLKIAAGNKDDGYSAAPEDAALLAAAAQAAAVVASAADIRSFTTSTADINNAIVAAENRLRAEFVASGGATEAFVTNYAYGRADIDQAQAEQSSTLTTAFQQHGIALQGQTLASSAADVRQYALSKSDATSAFASQYSQLTADYRIYTDNAKTQAIATSNADMRDYSVAKADLAGAIAQSTSQLTTTVGGHTATLQTQAQSLNGLSAQYTVKVDNNGRVSGFGLASTPVNGVAYSIFAINADAFTVGAPGVANKQMFAVGQVKGVTQMVVAGDVIADGSITASALKIGGSDNIIPDPKFYDLGWWGRVGTAVGDYAGQNNGWMGGAIMLIQPYDGNVRTSTSKAFATTPGATMRLEVQVELSANFEGEFSVFFYVEGGGLQSMGCPNVGTWNTGGYPGWPIQFNSQSTKGRLNFSQEFVIPLNSQCSIGHMVIVDRLGAGSVAFGSCSATRVADSTLIGPGSIETKHMTIANGGHIASGMTGFDIGNGWWLEGAMPGGHGARFAVGDSLGRRLICDPQNNIMKLVNFEDGTPQFQASISTTSGQGYFTGPKAGFTFAVFYLSTTNGVGPYSINWTIDNPNLPTAQAIITSDTHGTQVIVKGISQVPGEFDFSLNVTVVGANNKTAVANFLVTGNFT